MTPGSPPGSVPGARVALDVHALQVEGWADRGVGRYVAGYSAALHRRGVVAAALLAPELPPPAGLPPELVHAGAAGWDSARLCRDLLSSGTPLVHHVTAPFLDLARSPAWERAGVARAVLLHDLIPLRAPNHYLPTPALLARYRDRAEWVGRSELILTNSEHTRAEAVELLGCRPGDVVTVGVGVSAFFSPPDGTDEQLWRSRFGRLADRPFMLTVGGSDARKGTERVVAALGQLVAGGVDLRLVVAGHLTDEWWRKLRLLAAGCGVGERVLLAGAVPDDMLRACYRRAVLTVMPSLAEGAGLPVLESAACGTPALASAGTALAETAATPAALFDAADVDSISSAVARALGDPAVRSAILGAQSRLASESSWDVVAARAATALERVAREVPPPTLRLALIVPPGGAAPPAGLVEALGGHFDVDVLHGPAHRAASYDRVLYAGAPPVPCAAGWFWLDAPPTRRLLGALARHACGFIVGSERSRRQVEMALPALAAHPPVVVVAASAPGAQADGLAGALATVRGDGVPGDGVRGDGVRGDGFEAG